MIDLLERLRRDDPSALEEVGHELLPFVQAAVLASRFELREQAALLQLFRAEVALATRSSDAVGFFAAVVGKLRARASTLPLSPPDPGLSEALARLALLEPLPIAEREVVIARFVERLPSALTGKHFGLDPSALAAVLARGAALLVGPPLGAADWTGEPSLLEPDAPPVAQFIELENALTCLAIDVTALERQPLISPVPALKPGFEPQVPQEHYPSKVATQGFVDLPADFASFGPAGGGEPGVEVTSSAPTPLPLAILRSNLLPEDGTEPQGVPIVLPPRDDTTAPRARPLSAQAAEKTETQGSPLLAPPVEVTETRGRPLMPPPVEVTEARARPLMPPPVEVTEARARPLTPDADQTEVRVPIAPAPRALPFHRRLPAGWWWGAAALCAALGVSLYWGTVSYLQLRVQRQWTMVPVIAAARDLPEGTRITLEMMAIRAVPGQNVTASVVKPESLQYALGRTLEFPLQAGDPLLWTQFDGAQKYKRFHVLKRGRAYTIAVTELRSLGGNLMPNEEVDLVLAINQAPSSPAVKAKPRALTLLQKVRVLSVGAVTTLNIGRVQRRFTDLTLMLVPEEVEVLSLARRSGEITATLRQSDDDDLIARGETSEQTLLSGVRLKALERRRGAVIANIREHPSR